MSPASISAIQRKLMVLERSGAGGFFGEPALEVSELLKTDRYGKGFIHILEANELSQSPRLYGTVLLWLLAELFEDLPEAGDVAKPRLVLIFDEAHLMFDDAPKALVEKTEQVARLIRSKGVGLYFVTQSPLDIPSGIAGQLGNRIQHALRAFTENDRRSVRAVAGSFRSNPAFDAETAITELGVGEALVSTLGKGGVPSVVERILLRPPASRIGMASAEERVAAQSWSPWAGRYDRPVNRESASEILAARTEQMSLDAAEAAARAEEQREQRRESARPRGRSREGIGEAMMKSVARSIGSRVGREIVRGILGSIFKGR